MKERPILFSAAMVRAILSGAKSQTRRMVKPQPTAHDAYPSRAVIERWQGKHLLVVDARSAQALEFCPYGVPGDRLWIRETCVAHEQPDGLDGVTFLADIAFQPIENTPAAADAWVKLNHYGGRGKGHVVPAIHMPRWASRITLELTGVRVERLQDISAVDAWAEGIPGAPPLGVHIERIDEWVRWSDGVMREDPRMAYRELWEAINGPGSWATNPYVWVIEFRRVQPGA